MKERFLNNLSIYNLQSEMMKNGVSSDLGWLEGVTGGVLHYLGVLRGHTVRPGRRLSHHLKKTEH